MRVRALIVAAVVSAAFGAALAQTPEPPEAFTPRFEPRRDVSGRIYSREGFAWRTGGRAILCCAADAERNLSCDIAYENPEGEGFGETAERLYERAMRLREESYAEYVSVMPGGRFPVSWRFQQPGLEAPPLPDGFDAPALCAMRPLTPD